MKSIDTAEKVLNGEFTFEYVKKQAQLEHKKKLAEYQNKQQLSDTSIKKKIKKDDNSSLNGDNLRNSETTSQRTNKDKKEVKSEQNIEKEKVQQPPRVNLRKNSVSSKVSNSKQTTLQDIANEVKVLKKTNTLINEEDVKQYLDSNQEVLISQNELYKSINKLFELLQQNSINTRKNSYKLVLSKENSTNCEKLLKKLQSVYQNYMQKSNNEAKIETQLKNLKTQILDQVTKQLFHPNTKKLNKAIVESYKKNQRLAKMIEQQQNNKKKQLDESAQKDQQNNLMQKSKSDNTQDHETSLLKDNSIKTEGQEFHSPPHQNFKPSLAEKMLIEEQKTDSQQDSKEGQQNENESFLSQSVKKDSYNENLLQQNSGIKKPNLRSNVCINLAKKLQNHLERKFAQDYSITIEEKIRTEYPEMNEDYKQSVQKFMKNLNKEENFDIKNFTTQIEIIKDQSFTEFQSKVFTNPEN